MVTPLEFALHQPRHLAASLAIGNLSFAIGCALQQLGQEQLGLGGRGPSLIQIDQTAPQLAMFQGDHTAQTPERRLRHGDRFLRVGLLCARSHHP